MDSVCFEIQLSQVDIWTNCFCILPAKFPCKVHNILQESVIILIFLDRENIYFTG